jgi:hypothetical protein
VGTVHYKKTDRYIGLYPEGQFLKLNSIINNNPTLN